MVRFGYKRLIKMTDDSLSALCNAGTWKGKRIDHVTKRHACVVLWERKKKAMQ